MESNENFKEREEMSEIVCDEFKIITSFNLQGITVQAVINNVTKTFTLNNLSSVSGTNRRKIRSRRRRRKRRSVKTM